MTKSTFTSCWKTEGNGGALALTASGSKLFIERGGCINMQRDDGSGGFIMMFVCSVGSNCKESDWITVYSFQKKN